MDVLRGSSTPGRKLDRPAIAIGNFDGVHLGHRRLIEKARAVGGAVVVLTFEPHPARVLGPGLAPRLITPLDRKLELLAAAGVDLAVVEPFDRALAGHSPAEFAERCLARLGAHAVVVGYDFTFGHQRAGTTATLAELGAGLGFAVHVVEPVTVDGLVASSTRIRNFLAEGNLGGARLLLGRDFDRDGVVIRGAGRGKDLGVPTANLEVAGELLPAPGIYATWVERLAEPGRRYPAATSLGQNPTFAGDGRLHLEAHLLDFAADLYGERLRVGFVERLRDERRFPDVASLIEQIQRDIAETRAVLATHPARADR